MALVRLSPTAQEEFGDLPLTIQSRVRDVFVRLARWPNVSGAKPLRATWAGHYRIRTGDWRILFHIVQPDTVMVIRIQHRRDAYEGG